MTGVQHSFLVVVCIPGCIRCSLPPSLCMYSILSVDLLALYQYIKRFEDWAPVASKMKPVASACTLEDGLFHDDFECDELRYPFPWPQHKKAAVTDGRLHRPKPQDHHLPYVRTNKTHPCNLL